MATCVGILLGLAIGWVSYRYQGTFAELASAALGGIGTFMMFGGARMVVAVSASPSRLSAVSDALGPILPAVLDTVSGLGVGLLVGRTLTHVYWRCVHVEPMTTPESERARVLQHYGYTDPVDARMNSRRSR